MSTLDQFGKPELTPNVESLQAAVAAFNDALSQEGYLPDEVSLSLGELQQFGDTKRSDFYKVRERRKNRNTQKILGRDVIYFSFKLPPKPEQTNTRQTAFTIPDLRSELITEQIQRWRANGSIPPHEPDSKFSRPAQQALFRALSNRISAGMEYDLQRGALYLLEEVVIKRLSNLLSNPDAETQEALEKPVAIAQDLFAAIKDEKAEVRIDVVDQSKQKVKAGEHPNLLIVRIARKDWEEETDNT